MEVTRARNLHHVGRGRWTRWWRWWAGRLRCVQTRRKTTFERHTHEGNKSRGGARIRAPREEGGCKVKWKATRACNARRNSKETTTVGRVPCRARMCVCAHVCMGLLNMHARVCVPVVCTQSFCGWLPRVPPWGAKELRPPPSGTCTVIAHGSKTHLTTRSSGS